MSATSGTKAGLRQSLVAARRRRDPSVRAAAAEAIAQHAATTPALVRARRIAAYLSMPSEPGTGPLLELLHARGVDIVVPLSRPDHTLDWVRWSPGVATRRTPLGIAEPSGDPLGPDALTTVDVVLLPALAVDHAGVRLGRGAGYYDRALAGLPVLRCAIVFADEVCPRLPAEPHDVPVDLVLTDAGLFRPERT